MRRTSLAKAKANLSRLVDAAEHRGQRIVILRHGRPAAALVPVDVAMPPAAPPARVVKAGSVARRVRRFVEEFSAAEPEISAVEDVRAGRR